MSAALFFIRPLPTVIVALYFYFFLRRAAGFRGLSIEKRLTRLLIGLAAFAVGSLMLMLRGTAVLFVLMILLFGLIMDFLHLILHYPLRNTKWDQIWRCGLIPVLIAAILVPYGYFRMRDIHETHYTVTSEKISEETRILFVSDLHFGTAMDTERLREVCGQMQETKPDLVILGGDIVDESTEKADMQAAFAAFGKLKSTYGTYYVYGNHDRATYRADSAFTPDELQTALAESGITVLRDSSIDLGVLTLIGRNDRTGGSRPAARELINDNSAFLLLIDHQPVEAEENAAAGIDLMLSGHTHNGQIWPIAYINAMIGPKYGEYTFGDMKLFVSSGICGWGYPVRTQGVSEYVLIDLLPAG